MFLKEIEMQGFKSFADKTTVEFDRGVTAVVGPNGSGKSNITESLRWALGESSAKSLRGGKMPDVIFAGTENRKPLNFARVTVVLDNSDQFITSAGKDIRVERHIYRNGDSDYLIDGKKVRLRDIHDLFMDTGLGRDSFSIISQGRVEEIFNSKPEERRAIFEEAAGVLKYKTRKKETQTKLNQTQDNLDRLDDIIYELESQTKPLERQAQIAKTFLDLEEKRKADQLDLLVHGISKKKGQLDSGQADLEAVKTALSDYYQSRHQLEEKNQKLKRQRQTLSQQMEQKQGQLLELTRLISDLNNQIQMIQLENSQQAEKKELSQANLNQLKQEKADLEASLVLKSQEIDRLSTDLQEQKKAIQNLKTELSRFSTNPDDIIESLREDFVRLMQKEADISNQLTSLDSEMVKQKELSEAKVAELETVTVTLKETQGLAQSQAQKLAEARADLADLLKTYQALERAVQQMAQDYQNKQQLMFQHLDDLKTKEARCNSLETILKNHSNFYAGVKAVLNQAQSLGGIVGAVSEHLTFETRYQTALEIALGASSQHIIVEDETAAKTAIAFLKKNRQGRATFLPLTTIKSRQLAPHHLQKLAASQGYLGLASDLVSYDQRLAQIMENLLGVTAIFDSLEHANQAAKALRYQVRLVSLDGTELRPGGSFSGGASRHQNTTFIKPELDSLKQEIRETKAKQLAVEEELQTLKAERDRQETRLADIKEQGEHARLKEQKLSLNYDQLQEKLAELELLSEQLNQHQSVDGLEELTHQKSSLASELAEINQKKAAISQEIKGIKENKDSIHQRVEQLQQALSNLRLTERDTLNQHQFACETKKRLENEREKIEAEMTALTHLLTSQNQTVKAEQLPQLKQQLDLAKTSQEDDEKSLVRLRFELEDCQGQLDDVEERLHKMGQKNEELIRQQTKLEADIANLSEQLRQFARQLSEDYQVTFSEAQAQAKPIANEEKASQSLRQLERQIKALGPVNLEAIEQYDEVYHRCQFLNGQKSDLVDAKNLLLATINDMDDEVKARFKTSFEAIRESFQTTFKQMFGGGRADLLLTENDWLRAGVDIEVQPPGKKIQSLNLMSGGEKALSALALLFAIIRVKTIPFVILDEVEAALDEANVKRFGDYLNRFDKSSQFIVVTHRKGTMSAADSIYGVTMQESGVSKIVSVKLKDMANFD